MAWSRVKATGSGAIAWRIMIAGHPYEWVSDPALVGASTEGRTRIGGLDGASVSWGERLDPAQCKLTGQGFTARIIEDGAHRTGDSLTRQPTRINYLTSSITSGSATIPLTSTNTANGDVLYIGQECMLITSGGGTASPTVTRGYRDTLAQAHVYTPGVGLTRPEVTLEDSGAANGRPSVKGLLAYVYAYGDGETGDGTLVWRGICGEPKQRGTTAWDLPLESVTTILDQTLSSDLQDPVALRGVVYTSTTAPEMQITRLGSATSAGTPTTDTARIEFPAGYYETQADWCEAFNSAVTTATSGWGANALNVAGGAAPRLAAVPTIDGSWTLQFTAGATPYWHEVFCEGPLDPTIQNTGRYFLDQSTGERVATVVASTSYDITTSYPTPGAGTVPRGMVGPYSTRRPGRGGGGAFIADYLYLGGSATATTDDSVVIEWGPESGREPRTIVYSVSEWDASLRRIRLGFTPIGLASQRTWQRGATPKITIVRSYVELGNVADFIAALVTTAVDEAPEGRSPMVTTEHVDYAATQTAVDAITLGRAWVRNRYYAGSSDISLQKMLTEESKLIGMVPSITTSGQWRLVEFRIGAATETDAYTVDESTNLSGVQIPGFEPSAYGLINTVKLLTGWDPRDGKHHGDIFVVKDSTALSRQPLPSVMKIEPRSEASSGDTSIPIDDVTALAQSWLGVLASAYTSVTVACPLSAMDATIGTQVSVTVAQLPDTESGGRGMADVSGFVIGRQCRPMAAHVELTILCTQVRIAGYAPSSRVTSVTAGATRDVLLDAVQPTGYASAASWTVGDAVVLRQYDTSGPTEITATVTAVDTATRTITIGTISGATPAGTLNLEYGAASAAQASQWAYCYVADTDSTIGFSSERAARQFAS